MAKLIDIKNGDTYQGDKAVILLSGGIDSTVLLHWAIAAGMDVTAIEFTYNGRPDVEAQRNIEICKDAGIPLYSVDYPVIKPTLVPSFNGQTVSNDAPPALVESNSIYYILAGNCASQIGAKYILGGQILSDWEDTDIEQAHPEFYERINEILGKEFGEKAPGILMPFLHATKEDVVGLAVELDAPLDLTWTCPNDSHQECGACSQCEEKTRAYDAHGLDESGKPISQGSTGAGAPKP